MTNGPHCVVTTIPSDSHTWNLMYLQLLLEEHGASVRNLGCCVPIVDTLNAVEQEVPDVVVVSTVNGHGREQGIDLIQQAQERFGSRHPSFVIGGKPAVNASRYASVAEEFLRAGYSGVFLEGDAEREFTKFIDRLRDESRIERRAGAVAG